MTHLQQDRPEGNGLLNTACSMKTGSSAKDFYISPDIDEDTAYLIYLCQGYILYKQTYSHSPSFKNIAGSWTPQKQESLTMEVLNYEMAKELVSDCHACVQLITSKKHVTLPARYVCTMKQGIREHLTSELKLFSQDLDGVPLAFSNVKLLTSCGSIFEDQPFVHFDILAEFVLFKPQINSVLRGVVNKIGRDHVGCLVHSCFNASVPRPRGVGQGDGWAQNAPGLSLGQEFLFRVTQLFTQNGVVSMKGELIEGSLQPVNAASAMPQNGALNHIDDVTSDGKKKKRKKHKRDKNQYTPDGGGGSHDSGAGEGTSASRSRSLLVSPPLDIEALLNDSAQETADQMRWQPSHTHNAQRIKLENPADDRLSPGSELAHDSGIEASSEMNAPYSTTVPHRHNHHDHHHLDSRKRKRRHSDAGDVADDDTHTEDGSGEERKASKKKKKKKHKHIKVEAE